MMAYRRPPSSPLELAISASARPAGRQLKTESTAYNDNNNNDNNDDRAEPSDRRLVLCVRTPHRPLPARCVCACVCAIPR
jgi:hypothetical protein